MENQIGMKIEDAVETEIAKGYIDAILKSSGMTLSTSYLGSY